MCHTCSREPLVVIQFTFSWFTTFSAFHFIILRFFFLKQDPEDTDLYFIFFISFFWMYMDVSVYSGTYDGSESESPLDYHMTSS